MNDIQGYGAMPQTSPDLLRALAAGRQAGESGTRGTETGSPAALRMGAITNNEGRSLFEMRAEIQLAFREALAKGVHSGDARADIQAAMDAALEANGFDLAQLEAARFGSGGAPTTQQAAAQQAANTLANLSLPGTAEADLDAMFGDSEDDEDGESADDFMQMLLRQFRPGTSVDMQV